MRWPALLLCTVLLALVAAGVSSAERSVALPCLPGELRPTMKIANASGGGKSVTLTIRNIGAPCRFQVLGVIASGGATRQTVSSKRLRSIAIPRGRSARMLVGWRNWCGSIGPSQILFRIPGRGKELALPFFPAPKCTAPGKLSRITVGAPRLVPKPKR